jgi:hypothetical protein
VGKDAEGRAIGAPVTLLDLVSEEPRKSARFWLWSAGIPPLVSSALLLLRQRPPKKRETPCFWGGEESDMVEREEERDWVVGLRRAQEWSE